MSMSVSARIARNRFGDMMLIVRDPNRLHFATSFCLLGDGVAELLGHVDNWNAAGESIDPAADQACRDALRNAGITQLIYRDRGINLNEEGLADLVAPRTV
jgi:hypothetical protein